MKDNKIWWRLESKEDFYDTLVGWWTKRGFPVQDIEALPRKIFVGYTEDFDLYAIPVYDTDSSRCWVGFPSSNPEATKELKEGVLDWLFGIVETCMRYQGYKIIQTTSNTSPIVKVLEDRDYNGDESGVTFYAKKL
tara:strand:- start:1329 stop:1736 length:408 start_codon:yes stop_codon:yes gene_type:complete